MSAPDEAPGFRRRFVVTPGPDRVTAAVEDDYHCMAVTLHHDGARVTRVEAEMDRAPWTTCPGARAVLVATFAGASLADAARLGRKQANCTHLYDLALLAAAHAGDAAPLRYDIAVSDVGDGPVVAQIRRDGATLLKFEHLDDTMIAPAEIAGRSLFKLRDWIESLPEPQREAARLLQWGTLIAHGRAIPLAAQSDATRMPANCYTFQPGTREQARRVGRIVDFSRQAAGPLARWDGARFAPPAAGA